MSQLSGLIDEDREPELRNDPYYKRQQGALRGILADIPGGVVDVAALGLDYLAQGAESLLPKSASNLLGIPTFRKSMQKPFLGSAYIEEKLEDVGVLRPSTNTSEELMNRLAFGFLDGTPGAAGTTRLVSRSANYEGGKNLLYSPLEKALMDLPDKSPRTPGAWKNVLSKIKGREMPFIGVDDYLDALPQNEKIDIEDVQKFVGDNIVDIYERQKYLPGVNFPEEVAEEIAFTAQADAFYHSLPSDLREWLGENDFMAQVAGFDSAPDSIPPMGISTPFGEILDARDPKHFTQLEDQIKEIAEKNPLPEGYTPNGIVSLIKSETMPMMSNTAETLSKQYGAPSWAQSAGKYRYRGEGEIGSDKIPDETYRDMVLYLGKKGQIRFSSKPDESADYLPLMGERRRVMPAESFGNFDAGEVIDGTPIQSIMQYYPEGPDSPGVEIAMLQNGEYYTIADRDDILTSSLEEGVSFIFKKFLQEERNEVYFPQVEGGRYIIGSREEFPEAFEGEWIEHDNAVLFETRMGDVTRVPGTGSESSAESLEKFYDLPSRAGADPLTRPQQYARNLELSAAGRRDDEIENVYDPNFQSGHYPEENILTHQRFSFRTLPNGERTMLVEEVQSDWAQRGQKSGFKSPPAKIDQYLKTIEDEGFIFVPANQGMMGVGGQTGYYTTPEELTRFENDMGMIGEFNAYEVPMSSRFSQYIPEGFSVTYNPDGNFYEIKPPEGGSVGITVDNPEFANNENAAIAAAIDFNPDASDLFHDLNAKHFNLSTINSNPNIRNDFITAAENYYLPIPGQDVQDIISGQSDAIFSFDANGNVDKMLAYSNNEGTATMNLLKNLKNAQDSVASARKRLEKAGISTTNEVMQMDDGSGSKMYTVFNITPPGDFDGNYETFIRPDISDDAFTEGIVMTAQENLQNNNVDFQDMEEFYRDMGTIDKNLNRWGRGVSFAAEYDDAPEIAALSMVEPVKRFSLDEMPKNVQKAVKAIAKQGPIPEGPFVSDPNNPEWINLAAKRLVQVATENDADRIMFVPGKKQSERWDGTLPLKTAEFTYDKKFAGYLQKLENQYGEGNKIEDADITFPSYDQFNRETRIVENFPGIKLSEKLKKTAREGLPYLAIPLAGAAAQRERNGLISE